MTEKICPIKNWVPLDRAFHAVSALPQGSPRMILVHGSPGLGKTTAVGRLHLRHQGAYAYASTTWTKKSFLVKLAGRLGVTLRRKDTADAVLDAIFEKIETLQDGLIVIDEFDRISRSAGLVELVREIHDVSGIPIAVVGMDTIAKDLEAFPQFDQRIGERVEFKQVDIEDARSIATARCSVGVTDDLLAALLDRSGGVIRLLVTELAQVQATGLRDAIETVGLADMGI